MEIAMKESLKELDAIEIKAFKDKRETINEMSLVSARTFSTEETKRYAGSFNDPARMVANYAGVSGDAEGNNDIVVRGNSPKGILWRLEGIEIPNPNHFADEGSTGGPINALNSTMLSNSDFLTGAFAPEYGNAMSGVFDMKLRQGNADKREYTFDMGVIGTGLALEGPFKKGGKSSYLANYRYSSLSILDKAGIVDFGGIPKYQDGSFKIFVPTKKVGTFSLFGLGGISSITETTKDTVPDKKDLDISVYNAHLGLVGLNHVIIMSNKSYLKSAVLISKNGSRNEYSELNELDSYDLTYTSTLNKSSMKALTTFNHKFNAKSKLTSGLIYTQQYYHFFTEYKDYNGSLVRPLNKKGDAGFIQAFTSMKYRLTENVTMVGGLHYLNLTLNGSQSIEPRIAMAWKINNLNSINFGYGKHSKVESMLNYLAEVKQIDGSTETSNKNLELPKAHHLVAGFDHQITENTHVKVEAYYQYLYDIPVQNDSTSSYSLLNQNEWYTRRDLTNEGFGENYGLELTIERFFAKNYYYLFTGSLYKSKYQAMDDVWRNSRFDGTYSSNFLLGKEFSVGDKDKNKSLTLNIKASLLGGKRYTPIDLEASKEAYETIRDQSNPYGVKGDDIFFVNIAGGYKVNRPSATHEIKFEVLNVTNNKGKTNQYYNWVSEEIEYGTQLPLIPNIMYTVEF